ncbi:hypothetical protein [Tenacibaculum phage JQ]|nr:hypothetical protein [Tenacibaculum phage JQ]
MGLNEIKHYSKFNIPFDKNVGIYLWMESDYKKCKTIADVWAFYYNWHKDMQTTKNKYRYEAIKKIVYPLYSILTNKSYESQHNI